MTDEWKAGYRAAQAQAAALARLYERELVQMGKELLLLAPMRHGATGQEAEEDYEDRFHRARELGQASNAADDIAAAIDTMVPRDDLRERTPPKRRGRT